MVGIRVHACLKLTCPRRVPIDMLACRTHWAELPLKLKRRIIASYKAATLHQSEAYRAARAEADELLNGADMLPFEEAIDRG